MLQQQLIATLQSSQEYFERTIRSLREEHSGLTPVEGMFTAAQQVIHVAHTIEWFMDGAFERENGFDMDFAAYEQAVRATTSLQAAKDHLRNQYDAARTKLAAVPVKVLGSPLPEGPVLGGLPRLTVVQGIVDHTAHHRGALSVYVRHTGVAPAMPYADM